MTGSLSDIDWSNGVYYLKTEIDPEGGTSYQESGISQLLAVPYAQSSETSASALKGTARFEVNGTDGIPSDTALFEVKDKTGRTVSTVYDNGAKLIVDNTSKGGRGGFAVGGRGGPVE